MKVWTRLVAILRWAAVRKKPDYSLPVHAASTGGELHAKTRRRVEKHAAFLCALASLRETAFFFATAGEWNSGAGDWNICAGGWNAVEGEVITVGVGVPAASVPVPRAGVSVHRGGVPVKK